MSDPSRRPLWRLVFDGVERGVAAPLETVVRSEPFFDALAISTRARRAAAGHLERLSRRGLHALNLPAGSDIRRLNDQLARVDRRIVAMSKQLEAGGGFVHEGPSEPSDALRRILRAGTSPS
jgi:hypothetical protein